MWLCGGHLEGCMLLVGIDDQPILVLERVYCWLEAHSMTTASLGV